MYKVEMMENYTGNDSRIDYQGASKPRQPILESFPVYLSGENRICV
jgi:hypothetical protein